MELPETHQIGLFTIENHEIATANAGKEADFGIQIARDGRVWICINGVAWIRFKPTKAT
jgi:hypothetical protein